MAGRWTSHAEALGTGPKAQLCLVDEPLRVRLSARRPPRLPGLTASRQFVRMARAADLSLRLKRVMLAGVRLGGALGLAVERLPMYRLICLTWVPHWRGLPLPSATPPATRWLLLVSLTLADLAALRYHLRPYRMLAPVQRERLLLKLLNHPRPLLARAALLWKSVALLTA